MEPRILIVDDEEAVASMLRIVFEDTGYAVTVARSAAEALRLLSTESFDAVLTDMKMERDTSGYDVVRAARERSAHGVIVILTAFPLLAKEWRAVGADAALSKPSKMAVILGTIADLLQQSRQRSTGTN